LKEKIIGGRNTDMARIVGKQRKLDFNKNNKLDKQDFKILAKINKGKKKNGVSKKSKIA
jgi:hypothetical protein